MKYNEYNQYNESIKGQRHSQTFIKGETAIFYSKQFCLKIFSYYCNRSVLQRETIKIKKTIFF